MPKQLINSITVIAADRHSTYWIGQKMPLLKSKSNVGVRTISRIVDCSLEFEDSIFTAYALLDENNETIYRFENLPVILNYLPLEG